MARKVKGGFGRRLTDFLATAFLGWLFVVGMQGLSKILRTGTIVNRRGSDIDLSDNPLVFWTLSGFFAVGIIIVGSLALFCLWIALSNAFRK